MMLFSNGSFFERFVLVTYARAMVSACGTGLAVGEDILDSRLD